MGANGKMVQLILDASQGGGLATEAFPYDEEVTICLGSLLINVKKTSQYGFTLTSNCGIESFQTQDKISVIKGKAYPSVRGAFELEPVLLYNNKNKNKVQPESEKKDDGFFGYKEIVCGNRSGVKKYIPSCMLLIRDEKDRKIFPKFIEVAKELGMLWGYREVYDGFCDWHEDQGVKRANFLATWRTWIKRQKDYHPKFFRKSDDQLYAEQVEEMNRQLSEFETEWAKQTGDNS